MDPAFLLSQATGAWLQYEFACGRSPLFNERYMSVPISNALVGIYKHEVHSEYLHPVLAAAKTGPGRRPEVDFAVISQYPHVDCVLESKWIGDNGLTAEEVLWDVLRLELIAHSANVPAFFLLAGRRKYLEHFFQSRAFRGTSGKPGKYRSLLRLRPRHQRPIQISSPSIDRRNLFMKLLTPYQEVSFPYCLTTSFGYSYPEECPMYQYQAYVWHVFSPLGTARFFPKNHKLYRLEAQHPQSAPALNESPSHAAPPTE
jgi:hypothetical protein